MAEEILVDYISTLLRSKTKGDSVTHAASVLSDAASLVRLLDVRLSDREAPLGELCTKFLALAQEKSPVRKAAGLQALVAFAAESSRSAFLSGFATWAAEALTALRAWKSQPEDVLAASWALLMAIFQRVGRLLQIPGVRRDAAPLVPKLAAAFIQSHPQGGQTPLAAFRALNAALLALPAPFRSQIKTLEAPLVAGLLGPDAAPATRRAAAACFAALPRAGGDAEAWSAAFQQLLATAHALLDQAYLGLEPPGLIDVCKLGLDPRAAPLQPPAVATATEKKDSSAVIAYLTTFHQLDAVLRCLQTLLRAPFPSPVPLPSSGVLLLVTRLLSVDNGSLVERSSTASTGKLAELGLHLPGAQCAAFAVLQALLGAAGVQFTPLMLPAARLIGDQLEKVACSGTDAAVGGAAPAAKIALYSATVAVLRAGGGAAARVLAPKVLLCASAELYGVSQQQQQQQQGGMGAFKPARKKSRRQGKKGGAAFVAVEGEFDRGDNAGATSETVAALRTQAAFLQALAALLESGAALLTPAQRARADDIAAHAAGTAFSAALVARQDEGGQGGQLAALQEAALTALLASVLATVAHRPPHLSQALALFRHGARHQNAKVEATCTHALLCCEALMHPRSLPRPAPMAPAQPGAGQLGMPRFWSWVDAEGASSWHQQADAADGGGSADVYGEGMESEVQHQYLNGGTAAVEKRRSKRGREEARTGFFTGGAADGAAKPMDTEEARLQPASKAFAPSRPLSSEAEPTTAAAVRPSALPPKQAAPAASWQQQPVAKPPLPPLPSSRVGGDSSGDDEDSLPEIDSGESGSESD